MIGRLFAVALFCVAAFASAANAQTYRADTVVELYTSQGCTQCPRANRLVGMISGEDRILALTFPVSIWDYLGWQDTYAVPEFTARQRAFSHTLHSRRYTPQLIINGAQQMSASNWDEARAVIDQARARPISGPDIAITRPHANRVRITVGSGPRRAEPADIWLIAYDPGPLATYVTRGVNINRNVYHYNLARWVVNVGDWTGQPIYYERARCGPECAVIIQEPHGGRIIAAAFTGAPR